MKVFLAGIKGRYWLLERWKSISQAGTENGKSSQREREREREREYGYLHGWRYNGQPISVDEANNTHTHTHTQCRYISQGSIPSRMEPTHSLTHSLIVRLCLRVFSIAGKTMSFQSYFQRWEAFFLIVVRSLLCRVRLRLTGMNTRKNMRSGLRLTI